MARRKRLPSPEKDEPGLDISSLIDVCFLLLIYFLVTTQIVRKEQELSTTTPSTEPVTEPAKIAPLQILIEANGHVSLQNENGLTELLETDPNARELPSLARRLKLHKGLADVSGQAALVKLRVDGEAVQQRVIDVLNALAGANLTAITFTEGQPI